MLEQQLAKSQNIEEQLQKQAAQNQKAKPSSPPQEIFNIQSAQGTEKQQELSDARKKQKLLNLLSNGFINNNQQTDSRDGNLRIFIQNISHDRQLIKLKVHFKQYTFSDVDVIISDLISPVHTIQHKCFGMYGTTLMAKFKHQRIAIKCIKVEEKDEFEDAFEAALTEFLMARMASIIQAGPRICSQLGFSIFIYHNCIQFAMEYCQQMTPYSTQLQHQLKESLNNLHLLSIIHYDIKPENICFSPAYQKAIFIDFGLSDIATSKRGQKQYTSFRGSMQFCTEEMKKTFKKGKSYVDVYENDRFGLKLTIQQIKNTNFKDKDQPQLTTIQQLFQKPLIKFHILNYLSKEKIKSFFGELLETNKHKLGLYLQLVYETIYSFSYHSNIQSLFAKNGPLHYLKHKNYQLLNFTNIKLKKHKVLTKDGIQNNTQIETQFGLILSRYLPTLQGLKEPITKLQNFEYNKQASFEQFSLQIVKYIKVQALDISYSQKTKICHTFYKLFLKIEPESQQQTTFQTFQCLYSYCTNGDLNGLRINIIQQLLPSFLLMELFSEHDYLQLWRKCLSLCINSNSLESMKTLIIRFLESVQWLKTKIITKYSYKKMKQNIVEMYVNFIQNIKFSDPLVQILQLIKYVLKQVQNISRHQQQSYTYKARQHMQLQQIMNNRQHLNASNNITMENIVRFSLKSFNYQPILQLYNSICFSINNQKIIPLLHRIQQYLNYITYFFFQKSQKSAITYMRLKTSIFQEKAKVFKYIYFAIANEGPQEKRLWGSVYEQSFYFINLYRQSFDRYPFYPAFKLYLTGTLSYNRYKGKPEELAPFLNQYLMKNVAQQQVFQANIQIMRVQQVRSIPFEEIYHLSIIQKYKKFLYYIFVDQLKDTEKHSHLYVNSNYHKYHFKNFPLFTNLLKGMIDLTQSSSLSYSQFILGFTFDFISCFQCKFYLQFMLFRVRFMFQWLKPEQELLFFEGLVEVVLYLLKIREYNLILIIIHEYQVFYRVESLRASTMSLLYEVLQADCQLVILIILNNQYVSPLFLPKVVLHLLNEWKMDEIFTIFKLMVQKAFKVNSVQETKLFIARVIQIQYLFKKINSMQKFKQQIGSHVLRLLGIKEPNPYTSFIYIIIIECFQLDPKSKYRMDLLISKALDKLPLEIRMILQSGLYYYMTSRNVRRLDRNLGFKSLKNSQHYVDVAKMKNERSKKIRSFFRSIVKIKRHYNRYEKILMRKLQFYYRNNQNIYVLKQLDKVCSF